jgi:hypothetical protein
MGAIDGSDHAGCVHAGSVHAGAEGVHSHWRASRLASELEATDPKTVVEVTMTLNFVGSDVNGEGRTGAARRPDAPARARVRRGNNISGRIDKQRKTIIQTVTRQTNKLFDPANSECVCRACLRFGVTVTLLCVDSKGWLCAWEVPFYVLALKTFISNVMVVLMNRARREYSPLKLLLSSDDECHIATQLLHD